MICLAARQSLARDLRRFLGGDTSTDDLMDQIDSLDMADDTGLRAVAEDLDSMFLPFDVGEKAFLDREGWNRCQRMLLFLQSDLESAPILKRRLALRLTPASIVYVLVTGFGFWTCVVAQKMWCLLFLVPLVPIWTVYHLRSLCRMEAEEKDRKKREPLTSDVLYPFASVQAMVRALRANPGFRKQGYPEAMRQSWEKCGGSRPSFVGVMMFYGIGFVAWPLVVPFILIISISRPVTQMRLIA